jgi:hypothetical protein
LIEAPRNRTFPGDPMTQSKKPSKSSKSKKTTIASTSKKVKRTASEKRVELVAAPAVLETVAPTPAPVATPAAAVRTLSRAEFMVLVRKEAYSRAARRNFKNGSPFQDWVNAEAAVSGKLAAEGVRLS